MPSTFIPRVCIPVFSVILRVRVCALMCMGPYVRVYIIYIVCDNMVVFYKCIYTELLLCRSSWASMLQSVQDSLLRGPSCLLWTSWGWGSCLRLLNRRRWKRTHIHPPCSCHSPSSLRNDLSLSGMLPVGAKNTGLW